MCSYAKSNLIKINPAGDTNLIQTVNKPANIG